MALILASASAIRRSMLEQAGVEFIIQPGTVDETAEKRNYSDPVQLASALAEAKAINVSHDRPEEWVIGSDSVVSVGGRRFDKPQSICDSSRVSR